MPAINVDPNLVNRVARAAIISDIHGNLEGLEAVLRDIDRQGIEEVLCLGDIVGYGPNPRECVDLVRSRCRLSIRGNHDEALIHGPIGFTPMAKEAIEWTRRRLQPRFWRAGSVERWKYMEGLLIETTWKGFLLVHGSPRDPTSEYIMEREVILGERQKFAEIFTKFDQVCLVGHTHIAGVFYEGPRWVPERECADEFGFEGVKMVINVGSVGQPRDRDPRACYLTVDPDEARFRFHRLEYPIEKTRQKIHAIRALNPQLGDRLLGGM